MGIKIGGDSSPSYDYGDDDVGEAKPYQPSSPVQEYEPPQPAPPQVQELQNDGFVGPPAPPMVWSDRNDVAPPEASSTQGLASFRLPVGITMEPDWMAPPLSEAQGSSEAAAPHEAAHHGDHQLSTGMKVLDAAPWVADSVNAVSEGAMALGGKLASASVNAIELARRAEIASILDDALTPGSLMNAEAAGARMTSAAAAAEETFGDALRFGQSTERVAENVKAFLESKAVKVGGTALAGVAGGVIEYEESTAQTVGGKLSDAGLNAGLQSSFAWAASAPVLITDSALNLSTKYLLGEDGEKVNRAAGGFVSGNLATAGRAITSLGEAIVTGDNTGIDKFNEKSLKGDYGLIFKGFSEIGNNEWVREKGADAIEYGVEAAKAAGQRASERLQRIKNFFW